MKALHPAVLLAALSLSFAISFSAPDTSPPLVSDTRLGELEADSSDRTAENLLELGLAHDERRQHQRAAEFYRLAAAQGIGAAELRLGALCEIGQGVPQSYVAAKAHYERAITLGAPEAHLRLGLMHLEGWGMPADSTLAVAHIEQAAAAGYSPAQQVLSDMYFLGIEVPADPKKALLWAERAAASRNPASQLRVGAIHQAAVKLPQDLQLAREWYQLSAEQDYTRGMLAMAGTFFRPGVEPALFEIGVRWLDLAAEGGNAAAAFYRAGAYLRPTGTPPQSDATDEARRLLQQSAQAGEYAANEVLELEKAGWALPAAYAYVVSVPFEERYVQRVIRQPSPEPTGMSRPVPLKVVRPVYPAAMNLTRTEGETLIEFVVDTTGRIRDVKCIESSHPAFADIAADSVRAWRFAPGLKDGRPVNTRMRVPIRFQMSDLTGPYRRTDSPSTQPPTEAK